MSLQDLGSINFLEVPTVNGDNVIATQNNSIPYFSSGLLSALPTTGNVGRLYLATDAQQIYRDNGTTWDIIMYGGAPVVRQVLSGAIPNGFTNTIIPQDNTSPLISEGTQIWSQAFTPSYTGSKVQISMTAQADSTTATRTIIASIFRNSVNLGVGSVSIITASRPQQLALNVTDVSVSTTPVTYTCRVGISSAGTWFINQNSNPLYNGLLTKNAYFIQET